MDTIIVVIEIVLYVAMAKWKIFYLSQVSHIRLMVSEPIEIRMEEIFV
jgi:hypothetical protein